MRDIARRLILALYNIDEVYYLNEGRNKISDAELSVMYALDDGKPHSQREISQEWLVPKTTVNTIVKRWEKEGLLTQTPIQGKRREMNIMLTDTGREYAKSFMSFLYKAEDKVLKKTLDKYSDEFVITDYWTDNLLELILRKDNLNQAYKRVKSNKGAGGIDGMQVDELLPFLRKNQDRKMRSNFIASVSKTSAKTFRDKIKSLEIHKKTGCKINMIAEILNPLLRGWINYFGKFNPSAMKYTLQCIERRLVKWAMCKYKNFRGHRRRAEKWLLSVRKREPKLFAHWSKMYSYC